jgi:hypothetical protein
VISICYGDKVPARKSEKGPGDVGKSKASDFFLLTCCEV